MGNTGGNFSSPGHDGVRNYTNNLNCEWTIGNPSHYNSSTYISFEDFHLEYHQACQYDHLELRIGLCVQLSHALQLSWCQGFLRGVCRVLAVGSGHMRLFV